MSRAAITAASSCAGVTPTQLAREARGKLPSARCSMHSCSTLSSSVLSALLLLSAAVKSMRGLSRACSFHASGSPCIAAAPSMPGMQEKGSMSWMLHEGGGGAQEGGERDRREEQEEGGGGGGGGREEQEGGGGGGVLSMRSRMLSSASASSSSSSSSCERAQHATSSLHSCILLSCILLFLGAELSIPIILFIIPPPPPPALNCID
mmetsp:Transcript_62564/g.129981  ORF Transcript_62564/g.129981 Transcript_62564/m.129981 type:complete len:207 (-) Transcript_62564:2207-2827(-)